MEHFNASPQDLGIISFLFGMVFLFSCVAKEKISMIFSSERLREDAKKQLC